MNSNVISIDLAKNVFQVCLFNLHRVPIINKKVTRANLIKTVIKLDADRIVMEACYPYVPRYLSRLLIYPIFILGQIERLLHDQIFNRI
jgi:transposase